MRKFIDFIRRLLFVIFVVAAPLTALICTVTRFQNPELTETQLFLKCFN